MGYPLSKVCTPVHGEARGSGFAEVVGVREERLTEAEPEEKLAGGALRFWLNLFCFLEQ